MAKFWPEMAKFWQSQNFPIIYTMIFSKKTTREVSIYQKLWKLIAAFGRYRPKTLKNGYFGQKWPNFVHFWPFWGSKYISTKISFGGHLSHMDTQLHEKIRKKYWTVKAVGPEHTYKRTDAREWIYRFLPESKDIRGTKTRIETQILWSTAPRKSTKENLIID